MPWRKAIAEVELTQKIEQIINKKVLHDDFTILSAEFANVHRNGNEEFEFGMIGRNYVPYNRNLSNGFLLPSFSLFSKDITDSSDKSILYQILIHKANKKEYLLSKIIFPLLSSYITLIKSYGLIPEINSQNVLFLVNKNLGIETTVFRDLMGVEKDLSIRKELGINMEFDSNDYKVIEKSDPLYFKRHSFSYDFKLGFYFIEPIIHEFCNNFNQNIESLRSEIKNFALDCWDGFNKQYFKPYELWYNHPNELLTIKENRKYLENINPIYR